MQLERIGAIDSLRGLIMLLMALDHTRDFFLGFTPDPTDLQTTTPALFLTRWITHVCAPGFLLMAGMSAWLHGRGHSRRSLALFLATRGAVLVALEVTVVTFAWIPDPGGGLVFLQVIWAIGWSMILLAPLACFPAWVVGLLGLVLMGLGSLHDAGLLIGRDWLAVLLLEGGQQRLEPGHGWTLIVSYPILPWTGVMAAGYGLGPLMAGPAARWRPAILVLGASLLALFVVLRFSNLGGDPVPWLRYPDPAFTVLSFLNAEKYPPSPLYLLMTLGATLILLSAFARLDEFRVARVLRTLGRAPLFFYILHLYVLRVAGLTAAALVWGLDRLGPPPLHSTPEWTLPVVWAIWLVAMVILYWPTRWFALLKARRRGGWTSYL